MNDEQFVVSLNENSISDSEQEYKPPVPNTKSTKWFNGSYFHCNICDSRLWGEKEFMEHLTGVHEVNTPMNNLKSYASKCVEYKYTCKMCHKILKHERHYIGCHMKGVHNMTVLEYEHLHENKNITLTEGEESVVKKISISQDKLDETIEKEVNSEQQKEEQKQLLKDVPNPTAPADIKVEIKAEPYEAPRAVGRVAVYCCPLESCNFTTSREGMMDHRAATHLR